MAASYSASVVGGAVTIGSPLRFTWQVAQSVTRTFSECWSWHSKQTSFDATWANFAS
jgi:hypothetical protein